MLSIEARPSRCPEASITLTSRLVLVLLGGANAVSAQSLPVADPLSDYVRILEISGGATSGSTFVRPTHLSPAWLEGLGPHPWLERVERARRATSSEPGVNGANDQGVSVRPTGARVRTFVNTGHPFGFNDDAVWQGRGLSVGLDAGLELQWKALTARFHPTITYAQNTDFELAPTGWPDLPPVAYPWRVIDLPQRFGTDSHSSFDLGESEVRADVRGITLGVSNRNRWWGPGIRNAILMSDNAPGFHHAFLGTRRPADIGPGTLEVFYLHGGLEQSDWFDQSLAVNGRFVTGLVVAVSPDWPRGLSLGMGRVIYGLVPDSGRSLSHWFLPLQGLFKVGRATPDNPLGDDEEDQLLSLFARWVFPESGVEVYTEWARTDHAWDLRDFMLEPEHAQGRTLGLRHSTGLADGRLLVLGFELTDLSKTPTSQVRDNPTYYEHWLVTQGYTHRGQLLGASVGPGGSAQSVTIDLYAPWGRGGLVLERRVHDNDAYYLGAVSEEAFQCCHDVSFSGGPRLLLFRGDFEVDVQSTLTRELNRYFQRRNDVWNLNLALSGRWRPR